MYELYDINKITKRVAGVGIMDIKKGRSHILYDRWNSMIHRCYNVNDDDYSNYGNKGVYVCDEWLIFSNYVKDIESKDNYNLLKENPKSWEIDKDILICNNKCYSNSTTLIVSKTDNARQSQIKTMKKVCQLTTDGQLINVFESITQASKHLGIFKQSIYQCCNGKCKTAGGFKWEYQKVTS